MASTYKTPGVYVEEISTLPASVAQVETAIPAFIGYTEKAMDEGENLHLKPTRIGSLLEYRQRFGGPQNVKYQATVEADGDITFDVLEPLSYLLYHHLEMFFMNGGGDCYIVSIGQYAHASSMALADFTDGLNELAKADEPTIILLTDAVNLAEDDYYALTKSCLVQCADLQDRVAVLDVKGVPGDGAVASFRNGVGSNHLKYGAAYYPSLKTVIKKNYDEKALVVEGVAGGVGIKNYTINGAINVEYTGPDKDTDDDPIVPKLKIEKGSGTLGFSIDKYVLTIGNVGADSTGKKIEEEWANFPNKGDFSIAIDGEGSKTVKKLDTTLVAADVSLADLKINQTTLFNRIKKELDKDRVILPPSGAMAGIYAAVDADRGVWKAPANVSINGVINPTLVIDDKAQESLNVDVNGGKSINAIRSFVGKGTLVWGARTLAGNDNEWRYVPVRRFFNMVEESVKKSTHWAVFEPNDANTWIKVKAMIENFLTGLWRDGALAGAVPEDAFFVNVGLGTTMTSQDILEGYMIVEIGMAAVRPAEFIVLRFSHKLQE